MGGSFHGGGSGGLAARVFVGRVRRAASCTLNPRDIRNHKQRLGFFCNIFTFIIITREIAVFAFLCAAISSVIDCWSTCKVTKARHRKYRNQ